MTAPTTSRTGKVLLCLTALLCVSAFASSLHAQCRPGPPPPPPPPQVPLPWFWPQGLPPVTIPWGFPPPAPQPAPAPQQPDAATRFEDETLALTNQRRAMGATCGDRSFAPAPPLTMNAALRQAAREHSRDMGSRGYFEHTSLDGRSPDERMRAAGWSGRASGENIYGGPTTPAAVVDGWMKSPGHCANLMNPGYRLLGVGYAEVPGSPLTHYWTQDFGG